MSNLGLQFLDKTLGEQRVLDGINLEIADGEFVVVVGPSGCGKSTLLRILAGLDQPSSGEVLIDGVSALGTSPAQRGAAMVFQSYALYPHLNVYENIAFPLRLAKLPQTRIDTDVKRVANLLDIEDLMERRPKALSGGQRQRVAIGRAIVRQPRLLLLDEPLSNLDAALRVHMRHELARLHRELHTTTIYVTHDQVEAMTMADRIVVLNGGKIEQVDTPQNLYHHPENIFVASFIGSPRMNLMTGTLTGVTAGLAEVALVGGQHVRIAVDDACNGFSADIGGRVTLGVRPDSFRQSAEASNAIAVCVDVVELPGGPVTMYGEIEGHGAPLIAQFSAAQSLARGQVLNLAFDPVDGYLFDEAGCAFPRRRLH